MKYVFMGAGPIAKKCLEQYLNPENEAKLPVAIIADKDNLSIFKSSSPTIKLIEINSTDKKEDAIKIIFENFRPEFIVSVQYPWILPSSILSLVPNGAFNIHNAKLPDYRGHNALSYEILNGDKSHISTLHLMEPIVDRGNMVKSEEIDINEDDTAFSLWKRSIDSCVSLFHWLVILKNYKNVKSLQKPIIGEGKYYRKHDIHAAKILPKDADQETLIRYARAFHFPPHEPAYVLKGNKKIHCVPDWS